jgi:hypothetical protein
LCFADIADLAIETGKSASQRIVARDPRSMTPFTQRCVNSLVSNTVRI